MTIQDRYNPPIPGSQTDRAEYDKRVRYEVELSDAPKFQCNPDFYMSINDIIQNAEIGMYDEGTGELVLWRLNDDIRRSLVKKTPEALGFHQYLDQIYKLAVNAFEAQKVRGEKKAKSENDSMEYHTDCHSALDERLIEKRREQILIEDQKKKKPVHFSDDEKKRGVHWKTFPPEDLKRSRENLIDKKISHKKKVKKLVDKIAELEKEMDPFSEKIEGLRTRLDGDLDESDFKDVRLSIEYNELQIGKIRAKIAPLNEAKNNTTSEFAEIENKIKKLDILIDKEALLRESYNWERRRGRVVSRIEKILREGEELIQLREAVNQQWKKSTGDDEELIPSLGLKADSVMFFL